MPEASNIFVAVHWTTHEEGEYPYPEVIVNVNVDLEQAREAFREYINVNGLEWNEFSIEQHLNGEIAQLILDPPEPEDDFLYNDDDDAVEEDSAAI